jgi:hypothetical protein
MIKFACFTAVLATLILVGCGGDDDPVAPTPAAPPLVAGTIGGGGGELITPDLILSIPPGALTADTDLSIHADSEGSDMGSAAGPVFRVEGLPEELTAPVTLRLRFGAAKTESIMMFLGEERESYEGGRGLTWFAVATRDSAGWAIADLTRGPYVLDSEKATPSLKASLAEGMAASPTSGGHFRVYYDPQRTTLGQIALLSGELERAWNEVQDLGFNFGGQDIWPRPVYLRDLDHLGRLAQYTTAPWGRGHFTIDPDALVNSLAMGIIVGHEVLHCAQDFFDTRSPSQWKTLNYQRLALDEATACWFEGKFYPDGDFHPLSMNLTYYTMSLPMFAGLKHYSIAETGYGMSSLMKYIVDTQGEGRILEMYNQFPDVGFSEDAIQDVVDPPMAEWIVDFHHRQIMSQNYPFLQPGELWLDLPSDGALVGGGNQTDSTIMNLWEMGANVSVFTVTDERDEPAPFLKVRSGTSEPVQMSIFGLKEGQHPVLLGTALDSVRVEGLPDLTGQYDKFMTMGTRIEAFDPNSAQEIYPYRVVTMEEDGLAGFETATLWAMCNAQFATGIDQTMGLEIGSDAGRVSGNTYHAEWDSLDTADNAQHSGYLTVVFDLETMNVLSWSGESTTYYPENLTLLNTQVSGSGLDLAYNGGGEFRFGGRVPETCAAITHLEITHHRDGVLQNWLMSYICDENSYVAITLKDEK